MGKKNKKFFKIVVCKLTMDEYDSDKYSNKSKDYYRYGYTEKEVISKLRREFKMNVHTELVELSKTNSHLIPEDFNGKIFRHYDDCYGETAIYYEWYIQETVRAKHNIKKITILEDLLEDDEDAKK